MTVNRKDLICGLVFIVIGLLFAVGARDLDIGTATRMGPGYFPLVLCGLIIFLGVLISAKSFGKPDVDFGVIPWRALLLILPSTVIFGLTLKNIGLMPAVFIVALASSFSSSKMTVPLAFALSIGLSIFCAAVFKWGLGLPIELFGPWVRFW
ncbi:membrane protein [Terrihabitans soli]|uniref:Membrane protein n=1 Tax=Terrihabitans soli TaxID=708113 RepID=A0A6S6QVT0_9HYPH|nr:tripartite tricarboxylate transporter TctB family protein [Terrihabitans soli]BCJ91362.1 membrane protein [Terrihabitans soli]